MIVSKKLHFFLWKVICWFLIYWKFHLLVIDLKLRIENVILLMYFVLFLFLLAVCYWFYFKNISCHIINVNGPNNSNEISVHWEIIIYIVSSIWYSWAVTKDKNFVVFVMVKVYVTFIINDLCILCMYVYKRCCYLEF